MATTTADFSGIGTLAAHAAKAGVLSDDFERADGAVGNGWYSSTGETGQAISGGDLVRPGTGGYQTYVNPAQGALPADYTVTATIPASGFLPSGGFFGVVGRWDGTEGVQAFFDSAPTFANLAICSASTYQFQNVTVTADNAFPTSWVNGTAIDHTMAIKMTGTLIEVYLDGVLVGHGTDTVNAAKTGTGYGLSGEGAGRHWKSVATSTGAGQALTVAAALSGSGALTRKLASTAAASLSGTGTLTASTSVAAGVLSDDFERADGAVGNGWYSPTGETGQTISGGDLVRTGTGAYQTYVNPAQGTLPADYTVTATIPASGFLPSGGFFGVVGRWDGTEGVQAFFDAAPDSANLVICSASAYQFQTVAVTADNPFPASWVNGTAVDHTMAIKMTGTLIEVYLDGVLVGHGTDTVNAAKTGTGYGLSGEGGGRHWKSVATTASAGPALTATAALTGAGTLSATVTQTGGGGGAQSAALSGAGTLTAVATRITATTAAALTGPGTLAAAVPLRLTITAAAFGFGTLAATAGAGGAANAGLDQINIQPRTMVVLTATGIGSWAQMSGATVALTATGATATFTAPLTLGGATLIFGYGGDTVSVVVLPATERLVIGGVEVAAYSTKTS